MYGYAATVCSMRSMSGSTPGPRTSARRSGALPNHRPSGARWLIVTALPPRRTRKPVTSYTVNAGALAGLAAIHVLRPSSRTIGPRAPHTPGSPPLELPRDPAPVRSARGWRCASCLSNRDRDRHERVPAGAAAGAAAATSRVGACLTISRDGRDDKSPSALMRTALKVTINVDMYHAHREGLARLETARR